MLKQGTRPRGIMASGRVTSDGYEGPHWDAERAARGEFANYVDVKFDVLLDPSREELLVGQVLTLGTLSRVHWNPQARRCLTWRLRTSTSCGSTMCI